MKNMFFRILILCALFTGRAFAQNLPPDGTAGSLTVSGVSSGGFMAIQMFVAYSEVFSGAATMAGGIYNCANNNMFTAMTTCMKHPEDIDVNQVLTQATDFQSQHLIAPLQGMRGKPLFIYNGRNDLSVNPANAQKTVEFFQPFQMKVTLRTDVPSGHGFVSPRGTNECGLAVKPWINRCIVGNQPVDTAHDIFATLYGALNNPVAPVPAHLHIVKQPQDAFGSSMMAKSGAVYIPGSCETNPNACRWHIALHGCQQNPETVGADFYWKTSYADWAESNNIVVVFPAVSAGISNPNGCWDWWGYTDSNYANRKSLQMRAIFGMLNKIGYTPHIASRAHGREL